MRAAAADPNSALDVDDVALHIFMVREDGQEDAPGHAAPYERLCRPALSFCGHPHVKKLRRARARMNQGRFYKYMLKHFSRSTNSVHVCTGPTSEMQLLCLLVCSPSFFRYVTQMHRFFVTVFMQSVGS